jgi:hypothetical protein
MTLDPSFVMLEAEDVADVQVFRRHAVGAIDDYVSSVTPGSDGKRFSWRMQVVTENGSFATLMNVVRGQVFDDASPWWKVQGYGPPRDFAYTLYFGAEADGLNVTEGVLTAEQAQTFLGDLKFKQRKNPPAITEGALILDIDRYSGAVFKREVADRISGEHLRLMQIAEQIATVLLKDLEGE